MKTNLSVRSIIRAQSHRLWLAWLPLALLRKTMKTSTAVMMRMIAGLAVSCGAILLLEIQSQAAQTGTVVGWGGQVIPFVQPGTRFTVGSAGGVHNLALKSDGTVVAWGDNQAGQSTVPSGLSGVIAIAAGENHSLALVAPPNPTLVGLGLQQGVGFQLACYGLAGSNYTLQASTNLREWSIVQDFVGTNEPVYLRDPVATNHSRRFYRAVLPQ